MVIPRKEKESFLAKNLSYLRKIKGLTLNEMAELLSLKGRSSYKAYEEGRALPDIHKIMKIASLFDVGVAELVYQDLENTSVQSENEGRLFEICKVPIAAAAGYAKSFGDNSFIRELEKIKIPFEPYGIARAFDIEGDSMEPEIAGGETVVGIKLTNGEIKDKKSYILVTTEGVQCKHIRLDENGEVIYLISKNEKYSPKHVRIEDVLEIWEIWKKL